MAIPANLDAFLPREDFNADASKPKIHNEFSDMGLTDLREQLVHVLRKPDFQRTTDDWTPDQIMTFIKSFVEGDVIPGVIFWASPQTGNVLVIDGAHRISAMLAWVFDDYGDKERSQKFIGYQENADQFAAAKATRELVRDKVGTFADIFAAPTNPRSTARLKRLAASMTAMRFKIQWLHADARKAEESFYRINLRSVALNKTEIKLIRDRDKAAPIATRAIIQNGEGHQYWKNFPSNRSEETVRLAKEIHTLLFSPPLKNHIKSAHLPIGGKAYAGTAMEIALGMVEFCNKKKVRGPIGLKTTLALENTWKLLSKINGSHDGCIGLHPAIYFYSHSTGKHQPAALMAVSKWVDGFDKERFKAFTSVRYFFEEFLISNARALGDTISAKGSGGRSVPTLLSYYNLVLDRLLDGWNAAAIIAALKEQPKLYPFAERLPDNIIYGKDFSNETRSAAFLTDALNPGPRCRICWARYQPDSVNSDHILDKEHGGDGSPDNHGPSHIFCNGAKTAILPIIKSAWQRLGETYPPIQRALPPAS